MVKRIAKHPQFKGIVMNAAYQSERVTENEWKNDFELPKHLECGSLTTYKELYGKTDAIRDGYGLLTIKGRHVSVNCIQNTKMRLIRNNRQDMKVIVKGVMCIDDAAAAIEAGADAIWISNGGHLKSEGQPSTI